MSLQVPPESVLSFDCWLRATAAGGLLTFDLLLQQMAAIDAAGFSGIDFEGDKSYPQQQQQQQQQRKKGIKTVETSPHLRQRSHRLWQLLTLPL